MLIQGKWSKLPRTILQLNPEIEALAASGLIDARMAGRHDYFATRTTEGQARCEALAGEYTFQVGL